MIVKENISVYICEHCGKRMFRKHAMENHEPKCYSNPDNMRACSGCKFCEIITGGYHWDAFDGEHFTATKAFQCKLTKDKMYPAKVEIKGILDKYPESFEDQIAMPKECKYRVDENSYNDPKEHEVLRLFQTEI